MGLRVGSVWLALAIVLSGVVSTWALAPHDKAVGVPAHTKQVGSASSVQGNVGDAAPVRPVNQSAKSDGRQGGTDKRSKTGEELGTEFWPAFHGYRIKISDSIVAIAAAVTAVFTGMLWKSTDKLWSAGERQIKMIETNAANQSQDTRDALLISRNAAEASTQSAEAATKSTEMAHRTFVLNNRPRFLVRNIIIVRDEPITAFQGWLVTGTFDFYNVGGSTAHIVRADATSFWSERGLPMRHPLGSVRNPRGDRLQAIENAPIIPRRPIQPGEMDTGVYSSGKIAFNHIEAGRFNDMNIPYNLYVAIWIEFSDDFGLVRRSYFCQSFDRERGRFFPVNDPDYQYEE